MLPNQSQDSVNPHASDVWAWRPLQPRLQKVRQAVEKKDRPRKCVGQLKQEHFALFPQCSLSLEISRPNHESVFFLGLIRVSSGPPDPFLSVAGRIHAPRMLL